MNNVNIYLNTRNKNPNLSEESFASKINTKLSFFKKNIKLRNNRLTLRKMCL